MFLHIGGDILIPFEKIIAVLDTKVSLPASSALSSLSVQKAKSCLITEEGLFLSTIAPATLIRRIEEIKYGIMNSDV